tara:strand:+ start:1704 stop:2060 length:357 start_codon:yes stop_codon:yes gene_type:complete
MTDLIASFSSGKGTAAHVMKVIEGMEWDNIFLIVPEEFADQVTKPNNAQIITVDTTKTITDMAAHIHHSLNGKTKDFEVGLNLVSGSGREHMAILDAVLKLGMGIRLVALTKEGVKTL